MKQDDTIEYNALGWVKKELDAVLNEARIALEAYIENPEDQDRLTECSANIRQAQGTLQMVELFGAAMLAEEMSELVQAIADGSARNKDDAYEALIRAIIQLPDYLEHIQAGNKDIPMVLLPLMNDLRAGRNVPLLSENVLFFPDLDTHEEGPETSEVDLPPAEEEVQKLARGLRHSYQLALLGWFRDRDVKKSLKTMRAVLERLRKVSSTEKARRLWWISETLAESLYLDGVEAGVSTKQVLGQVDRQIKFLIDAGEPALVQEIPDDLVKNLLYYIATSESVSDQIKEVKKAFKLSDLLPTGQDLQVSEAQVGGLNFEILETVAKGIREDLNEIKDSLEVFIHTDDKSPEDLEPLADRLRKVADTLTMLGLGQARAIVLEDESRIRDMASGADAISEDSLLDVAGMILSVESVLNNFIEHRAVPGDIEELEAAAPPEEGALPEPDYKDLLNAVIREILTEMSRAKEAILEFISDPAQSEHLNDVPTMLESVKGAVSMLPMDRLVLVIESIQAYINREVLSTMKIPASSSLEALADAITSVEMYLESLDENRGDHLDILLFGEKSVAKLGYPAGAIPEEAEAVAEEPVEEPSELDKFPELAELEATEVLEQPAELEDDQTIELGIPDVDELPDEIELDESISFDTGIAEEAGGGETEVLEIGLPDEPALEEVADIEATQVIELQPTEELDQPAVVEEAEETEVLEFGLPDEATEAAVGGDEEEIAPTMVMDMGFLDEAQKAEEEVEELAVEEPEEEVEEEASETVQITMPNFDEAEETVSVVAEEPLAEEAAEDALSGDEFRDLEPIVGEMDEEILEIFLEEAEEEIDRIKEFLPRWKNNASDEEALTTIRRSYHTLKGSGRLVGAQLMGEFAWAFESMLNRVIDHTIRVDEHVHGSLEESIKGLEGLVSQIKEEGSPEIDVFQLMARAHAIAKGDFGKKPEGQAEEPGEVDESWAEEMMNDSGEEQPETIAVVEEEEEEEIPTVVVSAPEISEAEARAAAEDVDLLPLSETEEIVEEAPVEEDIVMSSDTMSLPVDLQAGEEEEPTVVAPVLEEVEPRIDPVLLDIFTTESREHLETLTRIHDESAENQASIPASHDLIRALHTLNGSSRTADVPEIFEICGPFEKYVKAMSDLDEDIPHEVLPHLKATIDYIDQALVCLADPMMSLPDHSALKQVSENLFDQAERQATSEGQPTETMAIPEGIGEGQPEAGQGESEAAAEPLGEPDLAGEQDMDLVEIFLEEAQEILDESDGTLQQWSDDYGDREAINEIQRQLHTLKGGARMAGFRNIGDLSHAVESLIIKAAEGEVPLSDTIFGALHQSMDRLSDMVGLAGKQEPVYPAPELIRNLDNLRTGKEVESAEVSEEPQETEEPVAEVPAVTKIAEEPEVSGVVDEEPAPVAEATPEIEVPAPEISEPEPQQEVAKPKAAEKETKDKAAKQAGQEVVRVRSDLLDNLVNFAGEVSIYHSRLEQQVNSFGYNLNEFDQTVSRLREQLRKLELETEAQILHNFEQDLATGEIDEEDAGFDPLEMDKYSGIQQLSRALAESVNDLLSIQELLVEQVRDTETLLLQQSRVSTELQEGLMRTRMVQFSGIGPRLRRIVRQTANELKKKVDLEIIGENSDLDRSVLDHMVAPLEHMIRNSISHGIEVPEERRAKGKSETGKLQIVVRREGSEILIECNDDGAGINLDKVRSKARTLGMISDSDDLSDHDAMQLILESGFSTASEVSQISGRGVGMDVVNNEIKQLGGVLEIESSQGKGTTFKINLPFTLAINQALMVQTGEDIFAVPLSSIEGIVRLPAGELSTRYDEKNPVIEYAAYDYELKHLNTLLGGTEVSHNDPNVMYPVLLVHSGGHRLALQVEGLLGSREVVVKSVGPQISKVRGISGATILGDGRVVLILDIPTLVRISTGIKLVYSAPEAGEEPAEEIVLPKVMVVDDSITIRKVTTRMLERNNFQVMTAKDGVDAVSTLQDDIPDLMLLDIEMPRMDGYELATYIRNDSRLQGIPIIMITSRTGEKHRQRAMDIGVNQYLGKPYQESELLEEINRLLEQEKAGKAV
jgi:chemosensory pili system protein ChpA (sensor histidine kinase/response regulator)